MKDEAIFNLYSNVISVTYNDNTAVATDANGNIVSWDASAVAAKEVELIAAHKLSELRTERNRLIAETDWWAMSDTPTMTSEQTTYRQALRDITNTYSSLDDVVWPTKP